MIFLLISLILSPCPHATGNEKDIILHDPILEQKIRYLMKKKVDNDEIGRKDFCRIIQLSRPAFSKWLRGTKLF